MNPVRNQTKPPETDTQEVKKSREKKSEHSFQTAVKASRVQDEVTPFKTSNNNNNHQKQRG